MKNYKKLYEKTNELNYVYSDVIRCTLNVLNFLKKGIDHNDKQFNPILNDIQNLFDQSEKLKVEIRVLESESLDIDFDTAPHPDTEADGYVFCGKCGKMK
jgi:hypothetical protein